MQTRITEVLSITARELELVTPHGQPGYVRRTILIDSSVDGMLELVVTANDFDALRIRPIEGAETETRPDGMSQRCPECGEFVHAADADCMRIARQQHVCSE